MAKHPKRRNRRMGRYLRGSVDEQQALSTLAGQTLALQIFDETVNERTLVSSIIATWGLRNWTPVQDAGPIVVGVAHSDYSATEIEQVIEASGSWDEGDLVQQEVAHRKIRRIGMFDIPADATESAVLNDGKPIRTKLNWILNQGQTLTQWAYNTGQAAVSDAVNPEVAIQGHVNLFPK